MNGKGRPGERVTPQKRRQAPSRGDDKRGGRLRYVRRRGTGPNPGIIVFIALIVTILAISLAVIIANRRGDATAIPEAETLTAPSETEPPEEPYLYVEETKDGVARGDLILVNYDHGYVFPESPDVVNLYENKNGDFKVAYSDVRMDRRIFAVFADLCRELHETTGENGLTVNSAYRSYDEQVEMWDMYVREQGEDAAKDYVTNPGFSEHHTGYAVDLGVVHDDGTVFSLPTSPEYDTISALLTRYGFILRYPEGKKAVTRVATEPWHYRFIGLPHSYIVEKTGLCFEEYIGFLKEFTFPDEVLILGTDGKLSIGGADAAAGYLIYFVPAETGTTRIPIPKDQSSYSVSGNNEDGFIVTVARGDPKNDVIAASPEVLTKAAAHVIGD